MKLSVIIPCHNYAHYLHACLESISSQSLMPDEVIVVDDDSSDHPELIVRDFSGRLPIQIIRVNFHDVTQTRRAGVLKATGDVICCIDADDTIGKYFFEYAIKHFSDPTVGIVYPDLYYVGSTIPRSYFPTHADEIIHQENFIHSSALFLRNAALLTGALDDHTKDSYEEWAMWRKIMRAGFKAVKHEGRYLYNVHPGGRSRVIDNEKLTYYIAAELEKEPITLFIPLSGRTALWDKLEKFLDAQVWPRNQTQLILMDTSQNSEYAKMIKKWICQCNYPDIHYLQQSVGVAGLADLIRADEYGTPYKEILREIIMAMSQIYNEMKNLSRTEYIWSLEDDVIPPLDFCQRALSQFHYNVVSVSSPYVNRYKQHYCVWKESKFLRYPESGSTLVDGNGLGCSILRRTFLNRVVFDGVEVPEKKLYKTKTVAEQAVIDWTMPATHISENFAFRHVILPKISWHNFDEKFYVEKYPDVASLVKQGMITTGYEHYLKVGRKERRQFRINN